MRVINVWNLVMISVRIHVRIFAYSVSCANVRCCCIYADIVMMGEPSCGESLAADM